MEPHYIPLEKCKHRGVYRIYARNFVEGVFHERKKGFLGIRDKWGHRYLAMECHWDTGAFFGTAQPEELITTLPDEVDIDNEDAVFNFLVELSKNTSP